MSEISSSIIYVSANYYLERLVSKLIYKLKRAPQAYRLSPDCGLKNLWEEICVQKQTDKWGGYNLVEYYLEGQISLLSEKLPYHVKLILSFNEEYEDLAYDEGVIVENILAELYRVAMNYSNKSIEKFLY